MHEQHPIPPVAPAVGVTTIADRFWSPRLTVNRTVTVPLEYSILERTHRIDALRWVASGRPAGAPEPHKFWDSDTAKWLEAAAYLLAEQPDPQLQATCDQVIELLAAAQQTDGYLNSHFSTLRPGERWTNLRDDHELYCLGHLVEAAVAYHHATGTDRFLAIMERAIAHVTGVIGPEAGKLPGYPGHEEIELALVKLAAATGNSEYRDLATYFVRERGRAPHFFALEAERRGQAAAADHAYWQAQCPVVDQSTAEGHAVRAAYLYAGVADIARLTGAADLRDAVDRIWDNIVTKRLYLTGGIGSSHIGERFTFDYDLPNDSTYCETCAAIALVFFAQRMFQLHAHARYIDVLEQALYNNVLAGVSLDGSEFFYDNYLESTPPYQAFARRNSPQRQPWFDCACCPPNVARLLASLSAYVYAGNGDAIWVNLYIAGKTVLPLGGVATTLAIQTDYPWDGKVTITVDRFDAPEAVSGRSGTLHLRVPGWCDSWAVYLNGNPVVAAAGDDGYVALTRRWQVGDSVAVEFDMPVRFVEAHPYARHNVGRLAVMRGPLVYCLEEVDNGPHLETLAVDLAAPTTVAMRSDLFAGAEYPIAVITGGARRATVDDWCGSLYRTARPATTGQARSTTMPAEFSAVPYFAWANRGAGQMAVWLPRL